MHPRRRTPYRVTIALLGLTMLLATTLVQAPTVNASSTILCKGFTACEKAGYSSFGYGPTNYKKMWWRMYSGHNCTNYMAYRMIKAGMPVDRPWSGSGDARNWGVVFKSKVNQTPKVGSVAWWSSNHVAYVQEVVDANTIIISEDHYRGDFDWRKITRAGGGWPTGFIHLADEAVTVTSPPAVLGTPKVDQSLAVKPGTWNRPGTAYKYQWLAAGAAITGATGTTYTPTPEQVGKTFAVKVIATKAGYKRGVATSPATVAAAPGTMVAEDIPVISGVAKVGAVLTASVPAVAPEPTSFKYAWFANGKYIAGGSRTSIALKPAQLGKVITFVATASRAGYEDLPTTAEPTDEVGPENLTVVEEPRLLGNPYVGKPLTVQAGSVTPEAQVTYQWLRKGVPIAGATGATYTPTPEDSWTRLKVQISYTKPGYTTIERELAPKRAVRSYARVYARSAAHKSVTVRVLANGVSVVRGQVRLVAKNGRSATVTLKRGVATFAESWLYKGTRTYDVEYLGSAKVVAKTRTVTLQVK